jgi:predicted permease
MRGLLSDLRHAVRRLAQQPGFALVAVLTLALGLGANTAIFTLIHAVMLRPLPVPRPGELHRLGDTNACCVNSGLQGSFSLFSYPLYEQFRNDLTSFRDLAAFQANVISTGVRPASAEAARMLRAAYVSGNYFPMLGVRPAAGRLLEPGDDRPGAPPVLVISHQAWTEQFGADPGVVGQTFYVNGTAMTVAGVTERSFFGETVRPDPAGMWLPLAQEPLVRGASSILARPDQHWLYAVGRLPSGTDPRSIDEQATRSLQTWLAAQSFMTERWRAQIPDQRIVVTSAASGVQLMRGNFGQQLTVLFAMSGLVLLIASANLANLLLARADRGQAAVRAAIGASASRLVRLSLVEGVVLALAGAAGAIVVAMFATRALIRAQFANATVPVDVTPSWPILLFSVGLALVTGVLFSALPAWSMGRTNPIDALRGAGRGGRDVAFVPRGSLVVVQVALSLLLLAGAGVFMKSLAKLESQPLGFEPSQRVVVYVDPPAIAGQPERLAAMYATMQDGLRRIPGVVNASYSLYSPMSGDNWSSYIAIAGRAIDPENRDGSSWNRVGPDFFETVGTRIVRGRGITATDTPTSARVAVVNLAFVRRFFPDSEPIGGRLGIGDAENAGDYEIVGVAEDVKFAGPTQPTRPMIFLPVMQMPPAATPQQMQVFARSTLVRSITIHTAGGTGSIEEAARRALAQAHPDLTVTRILPMTEQVSGNFRNNRMLAGLTSAYGVLALALAALGLYGVTSYGVTRRTQEIGVRMALGATRPQIVWSVLRGALLQTGIGLVLGVPLALMLAGFTAAYLYEVQARDVPVLAGAVATLLVTAIAAAIWPARRAAAVEPTNALRAQ